MDPNAGVSVEEMMDLPRPANHVEEREDPLRQPEISQEHVEQARAAGTNPANTADAKRRLMRDLKQLQRSGNTCFSASPINGDLFHWRAVVIGPDHTSWEGGIFKLRLDFTNEYPCSPPVVRFVTKNVFHPNVYVDGSICLDTLKTHWSPTLDVESLLMMIISLLSDPNPLSAANGEAAQLYTNSREKYHERVRRLVEESLEQDFSEEDE
ncbi:ubiquitin-conjugating enzyme e2 [Trypanosoma theileri]|uniref:Ubiquitin-conjugating enzyme e2 n=1 Tax=Trypanosoma theileri TaxID=67003 RepID=A0A1X0NT81_9TRYP|nr:ubiquitin-conjugating enzyme e2 [Trypanosoma theileri]ORC87914.1 ubiquitin-conjugating enzyme e2 [Trypanosoma theileri]